MHPEIETPTPEVAHVLFMDIVSYSLLPMDRQSEAIGQLQDIVRGLPEFEQAQRAGELVCLPTGDGMALAFFRDFTAPISCARRVALALGKEPPFQLRMGIHTGPVYRRADINTNLNVAGGGINLAQRVMDAGDAGSILMSKAMADMVGQLQAWSSVLHDLGEVEVKHGVRVHVFNVFTGEFGNPETPCKVLRARVSGAEPNLGRLVAKMCDRRAQEEDFRDSFLHALERGVPQIYFVGGEEGQCHESLVQRLIDRANRSVTVAGGDDSAGGRVKRIAWQYEGELAQRSSRLVYSLFENLGPAPSRQAYDPKRISAAAFAELLASSLNAFIAIQHEVHVSRWDSVTPDLLMNYVRFWNEVPGFPDRPPVLVFISVIFPRVEQSAWNKMMPFGSMTASMRKKRIWNTLKTLEQVSSAPCRVLAELPPITRADVLEWFSLNQIYDSEEKRLRAVNRLFPGGSMASKAMAEIEVFCAEELRNFAAERGYDDRWQWSKAVLGRGNSGLEAQSAAAAV
ncbi:MAG TPA: adenylate/guanylate cyclase domain-containing protein [Bryobacteraceae bacterium]|nr:adenylate/guanylate cyclase domain-containing protein [Bryobacteraceae bacterium]